MIEAYENANVVGWSVDFIRALMKRPLITRWILRFVFGKYAYREFIGLMNELDLKGFSPWSGYGLEGVDYHNDSVPAYWWVS